MKIGKESFYLSCIALLLGLCGQFYYSYKYIPAHERDIRVYYNQDIEANKKITDTIRSSDEYVYFAIYTFTRTDIEDALLGAKYRGLEVKGVVDRDQTDKIDAQKKIVHELERAGIPIVMQDHIGIMHMKTIVTDKAYASGSYNWTSAATNINDEILEVGYDPTIREQYKSILEKLFNKYQADPVP